MSDEPKPAARRTEWISHDNSQHIKFGVWLATTAAQLRWVSLAFAWTPAGAAVLVGSIVIEWAVGEFVIDPLVEAVAEKLAKPPEPEVKTGSPNVWIQDLNAVRGEDEDKTTKCHESVVAQGSKWVSINKKAASRWGDRTKCFGGATIQKNPGLPKEEVFIGGPPSNYSNTAGYHEKIKTIWSLFQIWRGFRNGFEVGIKNGAEIGKGAEAVGNFAGGKALDWFKSQF